MVSTDDSLDWKIVCFEVDDVSKDIGDYLKGIWPSKVSSIVVPSHDFYGRPAKAEVIKDLLSPFSKVGGKILTVYGSGYYHHMTYGLLCNVADLRSDNYTYLHIDQHTDNRILYINDRDIIHCGNFVSQIKKLDKVESVKYLGCKEVFHCVGLKQNLVDTPQIKSVGVEKSLQGLLSDAPSDVYVSMDLDVLICQQMCTGWQEGDMELDLFLNCLNYIKREKNIISADALGLNLAPSVYGENYSLCPASLLVYAMIAGTLFGDDISAFREEHKKLTKWLL